MLLHTCYYILSRSSRNVETQIRQSRQFQQSLGASRQEAVGRTISLSHRIPNLLNAYVRLLPKKNHRAKHWLISRADLTIVFIICLTREVHRAQHYFFTTSRVTRRGTGKIRPYRKTLPGRVDDSNGSTRLDGFNALRRRVMNGSCSNE